MSALAITGIRAIPLKLPSLIAAAEIPAPMDRHAAYRHRRTSWYGLMSPVLVLIETSDGLTGIGMTHGGRATAAVIDDHLGRLLLGQDPEPIEYLWDVCFRATMPYGPDGLAAMAVSGLDLALWDLAGKRLGRPVYALLGGPVRERTPAYASGNDAGWLAGLGFRHIKLAMQAGPWDGPGAAATNAAVVRRAREEIGPDTSLMVDAWMGWDREFAVRMADALAPFNLGWVEEPLPPDEIPNLAEIRAALGPVALATGEHLYTLAAFRGLLAAGGADILQPDPLWCGGITATRRICALAAAHGLPVLPHLGGAPWGLHLVAATPNCPMAEWYVGTLPGELLDSAPTVIRGAPVPEDGWITPTEVPGFGIEVDWESVERYGARPA